MCENEENKLKEISEKFYDIPVPEDINDYIYMGMRRGKQGKSRRRRHFFLSVATSLIIFSFIFTIRVSPVFADYVSKLPGMNTLVKLINYDKGLELAVKNKFYQEIGTFDVHDDIKVSVDGIMVDESRMIVFYTIEDFANHKPLDISKLRLVDEKGEHIRAGYGFGHIDLNKYEGNKVSDLIDVTFESGIPLPDNIIMNVKLQEFDIIDGNRQAKGELEPSWEIKIPIDKTKFKDMKKEYDLNKEAVVEGQKIYFDKLTIFPTRIALDIRYDEKNTMQIFSFEDLRLIDEHDEIFSSMKQGVISSGSVSDENVRTLYLQSNYFKNPEHLDLKVTTFKALPKPNTTIEVDLEKKVARNLPDDLELERVDEQEGKIYVIFKLYGKDNSFIFSHQFKVGENEYNAEYIAVSPRKDYSEIQFVVEDRNYNGPIELKITSYPSLIHGDIEIKVK